MLITNLQLINFRNYSKLDLSFNEIPTIFIGSNGAGKSNILEAVYLLATSKSPRAEEEIELIKKNEEAATVKGKIEENGDSNELMVTMVGSSPSVGTISEVKRFGKRVAVNGVGKRTLDFIGLLPAVIFWPSDINMVSGAPSLRRWHLDLALAQSSTTYKKSLTIYEQVLSNRNRVLKRIKEGLGRLDELTYWTDELITHGTVVSDKRKEFFQFINQLQSPLGNFLFEYLPSELSPERFVQYQEREIGATVTLIGPHRDDFRFMMLDLNSVIPAKAGIQLNTGLNIVPNQLLDPRMHGDDKQRDLSKYGSRGEQRMSTLAFKLAQLEYMSNVLGKRPVLLLDDVFSELDGAHRSAVAEVSKLQQTIIATVELENIPQDFLNSSRVIHVDNGKLD